MRIPKLSKRRITIASLLFISLYSIYTFPFLLYPIGNPYTGIKDQSPIYLQGKSLFISDVHFIGESLDLGSYLISESIDNLIIIGDLYHSPDIYDEFGIQNTLQLLNLEVYPGEIYFIWGTSNHDPHVNISTTNFQTMGSFGFFATAHYKILAHHGYLRSRRGGISFMFDHFISYPILQQLWRTRAGVPENIWVFTGHSHIAKLNHVLKIGNCGGFTDIPLFHPPLGEGILVDEQIQLVTVPF